MMVLAVSMEVTLCGLLKKSINVFFVPSVWHMVDVSVDVARVWVLMCLTDFEGGFSKLVYENLTYEVLDSICFRDTKK